MHPNGAPSTDAAGMSDADHQASGRDTVNVTWPVENEASENPAEEAEETPWGEAVEEASEPTGYSVKRS